ncbi:M20 family metallopeptidase [Candidatus Bipolaricaulota bacterium]|nr:M20 family metallopeptidase [Candidatus Bipolaricaulota bacterium]
MSNREPQVRDAVDRIESQLRVVSQQIFEHPEVKNEEVFASKLLATELKNAGFHVELGVAGLPTAIRAVHPAVSDGPVIAILGEYDALPGIGHACGHNLIAAGGLGAALAVGSMKAQLPGKLIFLGTPAEEGGGGKVLMIDAGLFEDVDVAMMFHPACNTMVGRGSLAITEVNIEFFGKPSHASASPEKGINALDAAIQTFNGINALRQHIKDGARIHGIISHGGIKPNIVPEYAAAEFYVRAQENGYRDELLEKLRHCAEGAALATGARMTFSEVGISYKAMKPNKILGELFLKHLIDCGIPHNPQRDDAMGSTDMGDVTQVVPGIHPYVQIAEDNVAGHSREFTEASGSERGAKAMLAAAKAMAMTTVNLLEDSELVSKLWEEFKTT